MRQFTTDDIVSSDDSTDIAVASTAVVYTKAFKIGFGDYFSLDYKAVSSNGSPELKIELEQSIEDALPVTEGSADDNYVEAEDASDIESALATETWNKKAITPPVGVYARLKITGGVGNNADTILNAKINQRQEI